ncbi:hypothetical protein EDF81_0776 [Enterobacter sp. BIGb0383]|uniref:hypothetical protein n=1 Tax=unclassified Enterobacter TaxID=2608935 RepID=UPI000F47FD94|nr:MULTISPECIES: hypothetical protein [unclassified Enterobacter]ROP62291.1 hypothetical protein EDF81_0776 [Enterobacter sp. BIGb0383]ROS12452.1 hypothetical protein EC848_0778 [Enterobacter sp. BIGb0359]
MSKENALFTQVKDDIAFDTLWPQVTTAITALSSEIWTDTGDHDPGITLLQAVTWNCSDLSYRASLSLNDLLTLKGQNTLFPLLFGPDHVLTCTTVTPEDYRRALRDLHSNDVPDLELDADCAPDFLFRDACLIREPEANRLHWWYDAQTREYSFTEPDDVSSDDKKQMLLRGNYWLYLLPTRLIGVLNPSGKTKVDQYLADFLTNHRNLGESVSRIIWLQPVTFSPQFTIELAEDINDVNPVVAQIYQTIEELLLPTATRQTTSQLQKAGYSSEAIFEGPLLQYGWQQASPSLISADGITLNLSQLFNRLQSIAGVTSISSFSPGELPGEMTAVSGDSWSWQVASGYFPQLWGDDPLTLLASASSPLTLIVKGGIYQRADSDAVLNAFSTTPLIQTTPVTLPAGKERDLAAYTPVGDRLPECYQLQQPDGVIDNTVRELHQFLLPADQQLADGCAELAALPRLLGFTDRDKLNAIRGTRWPYAADSVGQQVHQSYASALTTLQQQDAAVIPATPDANFARELDFIQYLLGYFGTSRAARPLTLDMADFLATQRAFLAQQPELGYDRTNIRIDKVSALQKRIAARIGLNSECFADNPDLGKLPFYVIEHRQLLPQTPDAGYDAEQTPDDFISDTKPIVKLNKAGSAGKIAKGQLIDLIAIEGDSRLVVGQQLVIDTDGDTVMFSTENSQQLVNDLDRLQSAWNAKNLRWQNSSIWLQDMDYRLNYADAALQPDNANQRLLVSSAQSPFPSMVAVGDTITIRPAGLASLPDTPAVSKVASVDADGDWLIEATIKAVDNIACTLLIEQEAGGDDFPSAEEAWRFQWNFDTAAYAFEDRFSFVVSIVHNRSMVEASNIDPAMLLTWLQQTIMAEFPAHVSLLNVWLSEPEFKNFAATYKRWQNNGIPLGDDAFAIMQMLTLGHLPVAQLGIGLMRIATEAQRTSVLGDDGTEWHTDIILDQELLYVPQDVTA